jgi:hypothetical protein
VRFILDAEREGNDVIEERRAAPIVLEFGWAQHPPKVNHVVGEQKELRLGSCGYGMYQGTQTDKLIGVVHKLAE